MCQAIMCKPGSGRGLDRGWASRRALALALWAWLAAPAPAQALIENYFIVPGESFLQLGAASGFSLDLGGGTEVFAPFVSQLGIVPGTSGLVLPGIGASDGLSTSLGGQLRVDLTTMLRLLPGGTTILPARSGTWGPGIPSSPAAPASASFGVAFSAPSLGLTGTAALRGTAFTMNMLPTVLTPQSATTSTFDAFALVSVLGGVVDFDTNLVGIDGRGFLDETQLFVTDASGGLLDELGGGLRRITMPFDVTIAVGPDDLGNLPVSATLALSGRIVAFNRPIPEPSALLMLALGSFGLGLARRAGRGGN